MNNAPDEFDDDVLAEISPEILAQLDGPPEQWLADLTNEALPAADVPREAMWAAIQQQRGSNTQPARELAFVIKRKTWISRAMLTTLVGAAATLAIGVAIGRYAMPHESAPQLAGRGASDSLRVASGAAQNLATSTAPLAIAVAEHFSRTEALLTTVRLDGVPQTGPQPKGSQDVANWARDLLGTTRLLLDDPSLRDVKVRHLLEDLELVLVQVVQARESDAPLVRRAPVETLRETNLLPRVRAASSGPTAMINTSYQRGISE